jgi:hypothetical protein
MDDPTIQPRPVTRYRWRCEAADCGKTADTELESELPKGWWRLYVENDRGGMSAIACSSSHAKQVIR